VVLRAVLHQTDSLTPQYFVRREDVVVTDKQIADPKVPGKITEQGVRDNVSA
jgi:malate synthase